LGGLREQGKQDLKLHPNGFEGKRGRNVRKRRLVENVVSLEGQNMARSRPSTVRSQMTCMGRGVAVESREKEVHEKGLLRRECCHTANKSGSKKKKAM